jgi:hypothetical protein
VVPDDGGGARASTRRASGDRRADRATSGRARVAGISCLGRQGKGLKSPNSHRRKLKDEVREKEITEDPRRSNRVNKAVLSFRTGTSWTW